MIVAAAVCPHPPLLIPELAAGAAPELDDLRAACDAAVGSIAAAGADALVTIGGDDGHRSCGFAPWGVPVPVAAEPLPLSLLVGEWLRARHGIEGQDRVAVPSGATAADCVGRGRVLADDPRRLALLVLGDGSACRGARAPGYDDPRAPAYDAEAARMLAEVDLDGVLGLDEALATELGVAGRPAWQVLAGVARATDARWRGRLHHHDAPYGVAYLVATWWAL